MYVWVITILLIQENKISYHKSVIPVGLLLTGLLWPWFLFICWAFYSFCFCGLGWTDCHEILAHRFKLVGAHQETDHQPQGSVPLAFNKPMFILWKTNWTYGHVYVYNHAIVILKIVWPGLVKEKCNKIRKGPLVTTFLS